MIRMPKAKAGFGLTELMVVLLILLLIASFSVPAVWRQIRNARDIAALTTLRSLQSVHRIARGTFLAEGRELALPVGRTVHIPHRADEAHHPYVDFVENVMTHAFAEQLPVYEIQETSTVEGTKTEFLYWPEPEKKPEQCYILREDVLYLATRAQLGTEQDKASTAGVASDTNEKTAVTSAALS